MGYSRVCIASSLLLVLKIYSCKGIYTIEIGFRAARAVKIYTRCEVFEFNPKIKVSQSSGPVCRLTEFVFGDMVLG